MTTKRKALLWVPVVAMVAFTSCKNDEKKEVAVVEEEAIPGINLEYLDPSVSPKTDFFRHVNGTWLDQNEIPADRTRWGSFDELRKKTDEDALGILKAAMADNKDLNKIEVLPGSDQEKAVQLFQTIMDTVSRDAQGIKPLEPYLAKIDGIENIQDLEDYLIEMEPMGGAGFFGFGVGSHPKNSDLNAAFLGTGSLGLSRDYYLDEDEDTKEKLEKYRKHIAKMLQYIGEDEATAQAKADNILAFETRMAKPRMTKEDRRDARKRFNPKSLEQLNEMTPSVNWEKYLTGIGVNEIDTVIVGDPGYFKALDAIIKENNVQEWKNYLDWTLLRRSSGLLSTEIDKANWEFYGRDLNGSKKQRDREERALSTINGSIGEALGKLYVDEKFPPEAKEKARKMIDNIKLAFENRIKNLDWMEPETKERAIEKLKKMNVKIAYPDQWEDYSTLEITGKEAGGTYFDNMKSVSKWNYEKDLADLGKPVDKSEWLMAPQVVNAYFMPPYNEIVFPAAILQPPFYNYEADMAVNYGGIGAVIGHEISHCFDDSGSRYDADGNLNNWWTEEDLKEFTTLGKQLADQYSAEKPFPDVNLNGAYTLGENIGDLGGVNAAYDGLQLYLKENGRPEAIDGYTPEQRFFMSWATVWRTKYTDDALRSQVKTGVHSPGMYRAVMPLKNIDAFYEAFEIKESDSMYLAPEARVKIW
ncbi:endothelin-converting protein [Mangrovimonas yunxiaonensis]|uniref:Endothelin-converting protein n=1 Tax=Mangrovimonas yunxiaonensis TaxID=1197477 RepID=A0A084TK68_9FLAO|nr:M13 family metallopeptidase [Mangrovimonas yunxiaonensis]KFB01104.1 endothelin-converting protein [Mangrovimonas yunxiaonensis]